LKYKLDSACLLFINPGNGFPAAFIHFANSFAMLLSLGFIFTFLSSVDFLSASVPRNGWSFEYALFGAMRLNLPNATDDYGILRVDQVAGA